MAWWCAPGRKGGVTCSAARPGPVRASRSAGRRTRPAVYVPVLPFDLGDPAAAGTPQLGPGTVPTAYGRISARWSSTAGGHRLELDVTAPRTTSGTIAVPAAKGSILLVNGRAALVAITDGYASLPVRGGTYSITVLRH
jgi:alpha-L-rhamnosidase-like protein